MSCRIPRESDAPQTLTLPQSPFAGPAFAQPPPQAVEPVLPLSDSAWSAKLPPSPKRMERIRALGTRDDTCQQALELRRRDVFERLSGESLSDAVTAHPHLDARLDRIERAIVRVPGLIGARRVCDQIKAGGVRALEHIEVLALVQREAQERNRLLEYVNVGATHERLRFSDWVEFVDCQKIGKREPEEIDHHRAWDLMRTGVEPLAALHAADAWPNATVDLGNDMQEQRAAQGDPTDPDGASATAPRQPRKSFDLSVLDETGALLGSVEVTTVSRPVCKPSDLASAVNHGIEKAKALRDEPVRYREVSIAVQWHEGRTEIENDRFIKYLGNGSYDVYQRGNGADQDRFLYRRDIMLDDLPHYLERRTGIWKWLECVNVLSADGKVSYRATRSKNVWEVEKKPLDPRSPLAKRRHARHEARRWMQTPRPDPHSGEHAALGELWSHRPDRRGLYTREA